MIRLLVFDFDGTIANSRRAVYGSFIDILSKIGCNFTYSDMKDKLGLLPIDETLKILGVSKNRKKIAEEINFRVKSKISEIKPVCPLSQLDKIKTEKMILSNSNSANIKKILKSWNYSGFAEIYGADNFSGKEDMLRKILKQRKIDAREMVYIGDRVNDISLARKVGCISVAITTKSAWSDYEDIASAEPDFMIKNWRELSRVIEELDF